MLSLKLGRKKSDKDVKVSPKPTPARPEPINNIFKETWWLWVIMLVLLAAIVVAINWDKIEPFIPK